MIPILLFAQVAAAASEPVQCSLNDMPLAHCRLIDTVRPDGAHRMTFKADRAHVLFVGRSQTGWWSGTLNGRPAMGYERNRGNVVFSTTDLKQRFSWWYPRDEHGTY